MGMNIIHCLSLVPICATETHYCYFLFLFRFGHPYEIPLVLQAVVMATWLLYMQYICLSLSDAPKREFHGYFDVNHFWQWSSFKDYLYIIVVFVAVMGTLTYIFVDSVVFVEGMGLLSLLLEAMLGLPQFLRNWRSKSTAGMSFGMVLSWFAGDTFKISYFVLRNAPLQFHVCGALQLCMDMALLLQVFAFRKTRTHTQKTFIENL
eukprot:m.53106 g.53106  ORF g.53106 m.53106 type:complete len:206 (+) comp11027_c0_seq6:209-826(+)